MSEPVHLTRRDARRIAVRAQLMDRPRPVGVRETLTRLGAVQVDLTAAVAPNVELVLWSRLGAGFDRSELRAALAERAFVEIEGFLRPAGHVALFLAEMHAWPDGDPSAGSETWHHAVGRWAAANDACRRDLLRHLAADGPLTAQELPDTCVVPWQSSGWTNHKNVTRLLEVMARRGQIAVAGRRGREREWDLASRVYPDVAAVPVVDARRRRDELRLASSGILRPSGPAHPAEPQDAGAAGVEVTVAGTSGRWRVDPGQLERIGERFLGRVALVSPLDRLVFDRRRLAELFDFDYALEMYKPPAQRRWGYFALPILDGDGFIGKVDATADARAGVLRVAAVHDDEPFGRREHEAVRRELADLAAWLELDLAW